MSASRYSGWRARAGNPGPVAPSASGSGNGGSASRGGASRGGSRTRRLSPEELDGLCSILGSASFTAFDVETTGLSPYDDRVVELGAVSFRMEESGGSWHCRELGRYEALCNPGRPIPPAVTAIHGISDLDVSFEPSFGERAPELLAFLGDSVLVAHNAAFDMGFLREECLRAGLPCPPNPAYDTIQLAMSAVPHLPSYALQALVKSFGLEAGRAHWGSDDARACMLLFARCISLLFSSAT